MSAYVKDVKKDTVKLVKNLGWLLNHAGQVHTIILRATGKRGDVGGQLTAYLHGDLVYMVTFASFDIAATFVRRKRFNHVKLEVKL